MINILMNKMLVWYLRRMIRQGNQFSGTIALYRLIYRLHLEEFTEDNEITIKTFMKDRMEDAFMGRDRNAMLKWEWNGDLHG